MKIQFSLIAITFSIFTIAISPVSSVFAQISQGETQNKQAQAYYDSAIAKYKLGDKKGAIAEFDNSIHIDTQFAKAYTGRGKMK
jgi:hypothetical protein